MNPSPAVVGKHVLVPVWVCHVHAGFPSPAQDHEEDGLDLTQHFVRNPAATFIIRVVGDSLIGANVQSGDLLLVDRSREPVSEDLVVAVIDGEFAAKRFVRHRGQVLLKAEHPAFSAIPWREGCEIWGVVASVHRDLVRPRC